MTVSGMATRGMFAETLVGKFVLRPQDPDVQRAWRAATGSPNLKMDPVFVPRSIVVLASLTEKAAADDKKPSIRARRGSWVICMLAFRIRSDKESCRIECLIS
jgi:hypothetical protein